MTGPLKISQNGITTYLQAANYGMALQAYKDGEYATDIRWLVIAHSDQRPDVNEALRFNYSKDGAGNSYTILHTGNKPSGSYTGNGSAAAREIDTKGIGHALMVFSGNGSAVVLPSGAIIIANGTVSGLGWNEAHFQAGVLTMGTTNAVLNANNENCVYQVL